MEASGKVIAVLTRHERRTGSRTLTEVAFTWAVVNGATGYVLQVGTATTLSDVYNNNVGNVLTAYLPLAAGTYYSRVVPQGAGSPTAEQTVVVA